MSAMSARRRSKSKTIPERFGQWISIVAGAASALWAIAALVSFPSSKIFTGEADLRRLIDEQQREAAVLKRGLQEAQAKLGAMSVELAKAKDELRTLRSLSLGGTPGRNPELIGLLLSTRNSVTEASGQVGQLKQRVESTDQRLKNLEVVILTDPQKALSLPLVRRDVEALQQQTSRDIEALRAENARSYDLMKWLIGLMALVSLSLIGTAAGHVFKRETPRELPKEAEKVSLPQAARNPAPAADGGAATEGQ